MLSSREFRIALFGGYNREDVHEYMQILEKESEMEIVKYQNKITELNEEIKKIQDEKNSLENAFQEYKTKMDFNTNEENKYSQELEKYILEIKNQMSENEKLKQTIASLETDKLYFIENKKHMEAMLQELKNNVCIEKNDQEALSEKYEDDLRAIAKVLEDARVNAHHIEEEAKKKADEILASAKEKSEKILSSRKSDIDKELEDKGIRLIAAKYKIEAYRKEINSTQQKLYNLCSDMGKLVDKMPQNLEQLWDEQGPFEISQKFETKENKEGTATIE